MVGGPFHPGELRVVWKQQINSILIEAVKERDMINRCEQTVFQINALRRNLIGLSWVVTMTFDVNLIDMSKK